MSQDFEYVTLESLINILKTNPDIKIEFQHTGCEGDTNYTYTDNYIVTDGRVEIFSFKIIKEYNARTRTDSFVLKIAGKIQRAWSDDSLNVLHDAVSSVWWKQKRKQWVENEQKKSEQKLEQEFKQNMDFLAGFIPTQKAR